MAAVEPPEKNDENSKQNKELQDNTRPISNGLSSPNLLSVSAPSYVHRLVVVSSKIRQPSALESAALNGVSILIYQQDGEDLNSLLSKIKEASSRTKPVSIAFLAHGHPGSMVLCSGRGEKVRRKTTFLTVANVFFFNAGNVRKQLTIIPFYALCNGHKTLQMLLHAQVFWFTSLENISLFLKVLNSKSL